MDVHNQQQLHQESEESSALQSVKLIFDKGSSPFIRLTLAVFASSAPPVITLIGGRTFTVASLEEQLVGKVWLIAEWTCVYIILAIDSQDGAGLEVFLIHPFGLAYLQDLCVAQVLQATLELVQGIRLQSQRSHDLLPHHLHDLQRRRGTGGHGEVIMRMQHPHRV
ncbi:hypothetical protein EYF80_004030 [Liparis tanakae]|uniref:Uncharacterized protein n=1 Tax=Liparis tanakae TaxID=230148 RepID=A0A4Z2J820_9TELE|nr:hypothetical protein EYF80_004030 [Liparis tanakae]